MAQTNSDDFESLWEQSLRLPAHKEVSVDKIKVDLTVTDLMDRYLKFCQQAVGQGQMKQDLYDRLAAQTTGYKEALTNVDHGLIQRLITNQLKPRRGGG